MAEEAALKSFEDIKQISETGNEFWSARDLQKPLGYEKWGLSVKFQAIIF